MPDPLETHRHSIGAAVSEVVVYPKGLLVLGKTLFPVKLTTSWALFPGVEVVNDEVNLALRFCR